MSMWTAYSLLLRNKSWRGPWTPHGPPFTRMIVVGGLVRPLRAAHAYPHIHTYTCYNRARQPSTKSHDTRLTARRSRSNTCCALTTSLCVPGYSFSRYCCKCSSTTQSHWSVHFR
eukprot:4363217-Pleurochrysis_carterae.AAC.1